MKRSFSSALKSKNFVLWETISRKQIRGKRSRGYPFDSKPVTFQGQSQQKKSLYLTFKFGFPVEVAVCLLSLRKSVGTRERHPSSLYDVNCDIKAIKFCITLKIKNIHVSNTWLPRSTSLETCSCR